VSEVGPFSVELIGRDTELAQVESFAELAATNGAALAIVGSAGIGKTALWRAGVAIAHERGLRVLETRCVEVEMPIPLGHLADLIGDVLDEIELPEPQRAALAVGLGLEAPEQGFTPDWLALARATLSVLTVLAGRSPLVVAVDDAQWLDPASSRVLTYALRRVAGIPVGVLMTVRTDAETADPLALADAGGFEALRVGPLSIGGLQHLVRTRLGVHLPRATLARIHEASGGNPMFALEFARLADDGPRAPTPLAVPRTLEDVVAARLERLPPAVRPLLEAASAVERPTVALLAAVLDEADVEALVELAVACDALVDTGGSLAFAHPLVKAAAYFRIAPTRRRALHRALATAAPTLEERGRHAALATVEPDSAVAALVGEAAEAAAARGALHAAAELGAEAGRIEPDPTRRAERARRARPARARRIGDREPTALDRVP
jgi:predicted ATPase